MKNKEERARLEGMAQALRIAKAKGIEGLEAEIKLRNITGLPCGVSKKAMDECINNIKCNVVDTVTLLAVFVLHSKWGFGKKRAQKFIEDMNLQAACQIFPKSSSSKAFRSRRLGLAADFRSLWRMNRCTQSTLAVAGRKESFTSCS